MGTRAFIGIGSNIGNAVHNCIQSIGLIIAYGPAKLLSTSSLYITSPVSDLPQDDFVNCAITIEWENSAIDLLQLLNHIEHVMGRVREVPSGPRVIDLDILLFNHLILENPLLVVPHPRLHERKFALVPCLEIDPLLIHPLYRKPLSVYLSILDDRQAISALTSAEEVSRLVGETVKTLRGKQLETAVQASNQFDKEI